jgi:hypothetical protein
MEHEKRAEALEREADAMERDSEKVGDHIEETRQEWEAKAADPAVPGAQPSGAEDDKDAERAGSDDHESVPGVEADEELLREEGGA